MDNSPPPADPPLPPLAEGLPSDAPPAQPPAEAPRPRRRLKLGLAITAGVLGVLVVAAIVASGPLARYLVVEQGRQQGVEITLGEVDLGWKGATIRDFEFALEDVEGITGKVEELEVEVAGLTPTRFAARGVDVEVVGSAATLAVALSEWTKNHPAMPRVPAKAEDVSLSWRAERGGTKWLTISRGEVLPKKTGGRFTAKRAEVFGIDVGKVGATWGGSATRIDLGFGADDLEQAPVHIEITELESEPVAQITLRPTELAQLAGPLGVSLPLEGVTVQGGAELFFGAAPERSPIKATFHATFEGYSPPVPQELTGFAFGSSTRLDGELEVSADRRRIDFKQAKLVHGALQLTGQGQIDRKPDTTTIALDLAGEIPCAELAKSVAKGGLGSSFGHLIEQAAGLLVEGTLRVRLKINADMSNLAGAQLTKEIGVGCGLKPLQGITLPELPDLSDLPELPELPALPLP